MPLAPFTIALTSPCPSESLSAYSAPGLIALSEKRGAQGSPGRWRPIDSRSCSTTAAAAARSAGAASSGGIGVRSGSAPGIGR